LASRRLHARLTRPTFPIYQAYRRWAARRGTLVPPPVGSPYYGVRRLRSIAPGAGMARQQYM